ncbi:hypothetical protein POM88_040165 [Heracleum sosnowskyi]|uniref:Uncharacterized protein n=1 Tax=Heracleum sosnowskyi TaxID=360622 RepID=A0AAD8HE10_9APIA|nr:hypothetical protein POM88_040165 [Heracleum sosnowskyi]
MHGLCKHGKVEEAFKLFERMEDEGVKADAITFNILIVGLPKTCRPPYRGGGRKGVDRYRRGGRGNFGNRGRGRWTPRQNSQQISSSGSGNVAPETTKSVEEVADASAINIDQASQVEIPYQSSVQPNVTSAPQRHMQVARCELCRVDCNSFEILEQHKGGKKH